MISILSFVSSNKAALHCRDWMRDNLKEITEVPKFNVIQSMHQRPPGYHLGMSSLTYSWPIFHLLL